VTAVLIGILTQLAQRGLPEPAAEPAAESSGSSMSPAPITAEPVKVAALNLSRTRLGSLHLRRSWSSGKRTSGR
jgi:hypothetical protein